MDFLGISEIFQSANQPTSQQLLTGGLGGWLKNLRSFQKIDLIGDFLYKSIKIVLKTYLAVWLAGWLAG